VSGTGYRRLPGTRRGVIARASAWAGEDHILLVEGSRVSETYKRVYFRDVQALLITKRNRFVIQTPWFLFLPALVVLLYRLPAEWQITGITAGVLVLAALVYLYVASVFYSCRFYIATAVGNVQVGSVFRVWQARRFHERVSPLILAAQQDLAVAALPPELPQ
jgi:hypothetical protein